jgi:UDP-glucose 4-epimerase
VAHAVYLPGSSRATPISNCLIVGGGFLGAHLAERLAEEAHAVTIFSRSFSDWLARKGGERSGIRLVEGEVPPGGPLLELIAAADVVFYMAGTSTPSMASADPGGSIVRAVVPAAAVLDLMREAPTRRIVVASSGGTVYGVAEQLPTPEDYPTRPISLHGHHSLTIERYAQFFAERHGFETIILRFSNPYGPGQVSRHGQGVIAAWSQALARDEPLLVFGDLTARRDFLFIDDLIEATVRAGLHAPPGTYNVGSGEATPLEDVLELLLAAKGGETAVVHAESRPVDVPVTQLDSSRVRRATGWAPVVSLPEGIKATWEWARARSAVGGSAPGG